MDIAELKVSMGYFDGSTVNFDSQYYLGIDWLKVKYL